MQETSGGADRSAKGEERDRVGLFDVFGTLHLQRANSARMKGCYQAVRSEFADEKNL